MATKVKPNDKYFELQAWNIAFGKRDKGLDQIPNFSSNVSLQGSGSDAKVSEYTRQ